MKSSAILVKTVSPREGNDMIPRSIQESNLYYQKVGRLSRAMRYHYANAPYYGGPPQSRTEFYGFAIRCLTVWLAVHGWGSWIRTSAYKSQSLVSYRLTIPQEKRRAYLPHMPEGSHIRYGHRY